MIKSFELMIRKYKKGERSKKHFQDRKYVQTN